jgi:hypothetical protein
VNACLQRETEGIDDGSGGVHAREGRVDDKVEERVMFGEGVEEDECTPIEVYGKEYYDQDLGIGTIHIAGIHIEYSQ